MIHELRGKWESWKQTIRQLQAKRRHEVHVTCEDMATEASTNNLELHNHDFCRAMRLLLQDTCQYNLPRDPSEKALHFVMPAKQHYYI